MALFLIGALTLSACGSDSDASGEDQQSSPTADAAGSEVAAPDDGTDGPDDGTDGPDDLGLGADVLEAAQEEGEVLHAGTLSAPVFEKLQAEFADAYGIQVENLLVGAGDGAEQIRSETRSGNHTIDVFGFGGWYGEVLASEELVEQWQPPNIDEWLLIDSDPQGYWFPFAVNVYGFGVNPELIPEENYPTSWDDLIEPPYDAPTLLFDPAIGSVGLLWFLEMHDSPDYGEEYLQQVADNPTLECTAVAADAISRLVRGDVGAYLPFSSQNLPDVEGTPVEFIIPEEGPVITNLNAGVVDGAPHPNAAKLWLTWLTSDAGQEIVAEGFQAPIRAGVEAASPEFDLNNVQPFYQAPYADVIEMLPNVEELTTNAGIC